MEINVEYCAICRRDIKNLFGQRLRLLVHCWYILTHPIDGEYVGKASIMSFCHHGDQSSIKCGVSSQRNLCHFFGS